MRDDRSPLHPERGAAPAARQPACPQCGGPLERIPRRWIDRLVSLVLPSRRYRCYSMGCDWVGRLRNGKHLLAVADAKRRYVQRIGPP